MACLFIILIDLITLISLMILKTGLILLMLDISSSWIDSFHNNIELKNYGVVGDGAEVDGAGMTLGISIVVVFCVGIVPRFAQSVR